MPSLNFMMFDTYNQSARGKSFDNSEQFAPGSKLTGRLQGFHENSLLKSFSADKERANNVARIKVVVSVFCLC